jgi:hypothetical protein
MTLDTKHTSSGLPLSQSLGQGFGVSMHLYVLQSLVVVGWLLVVDVLQSLVVVALSAGGVE